MLYPSGISIDTIVNSGYAKNQATEKGKASLISRNLVTQLVTQLVVLGVGWECLWVCLAIWKTLSLPFRSISTKPSAFRLVSNSVQWLA